MYIHLDTSLAACLTIAVS